MKRKFKVISFIMAATLLISTAAVLAESKSELFGVGESSGRARLRSEMEELAGVTLAYAEAITEPTYATSDQTTTYVAGTTMYGIIEDYGSTYAYVEYGLLHGAESTHTINGVAKHLSVRTS